MRAIRVLLIIQIALFAFAALTHFGVAVESHEHRAAGTAESVIGTVLLIGLLLTWPHHRFDQSQSQCKSLRCLARL